MNKEDIEKLLIENTNLFRTLCVYSQAFDIIPDNKDHYGAYIKYQDLMELRRDFLEALESTITEWVYSFEKRKNLKEEFMSDGWTESQSSHKLISKAKNKFRGRKTSNNDKLLIQGQLGELFLFNFIQHFLKAVPLLRKMPITTSNNMERFGADAIHYKIENDKNIIILGESKVYTSEYSFKKAFGDSIESILNTYKIHRQEIGLYVHEDFLDDKLNKVAEDYINNELENVEVHLVCFVAYNEKKKLSITSESEIHSQIEDIIKEKYAKFDNNKIDIKNNPILNRITYIVFPIWKLVDLAKEFQNMI